MVFWALMPTISGAGVGRQIIDSWYASAAESHCLSCVCGMGRLSAVDGKSIRDCRIGASESLETSPNRLVPSIIP